MTFKELYNAFKEHHINLKRALAAFATERNFGLNHPRYEELAEIVFEMSMRYGLDAFACANAICETIPFEEEERENAFIDDLKNHGKEFYRVVVFAYSNNDWFGD